MLSKPFGFAFVYSLSSTMIHGVERDAARIADAIAKRVSAREVAA